ARAMSTLLQSDTQSAAVDANVKRSRLESEELTFSALGEQLERAATHRPDSAGASSAPDNALLEAEVKIGCTNAMLLALDRELRIAYIVGDVFELRSDDAAYLLDIEPAGFRKRLSRARMRLRAFMQQHCGLIEGRASCRHEIAGVFQSHPRYRAPERLLRSVRAVIESGRFRLVE